MTTDQTSTTNVRDFIWAQKYRPNTISQCILPQRIKAHFEGMVSANQVSHLLLVGGPGMGKTTAALALANELGSDVMIINASMENGIDVLRTKIQSFASTVSLGDDTGPKIVIMDECLHEDEQVRIGTVDNWAPVALRELKRDTEYPVVSFNMETGELENDVGAIISDRIDEVFEVVLANGSKVRVNRKHPFICRATDGTFYERTIEQGLVGHDVVAV